MNQNYIQDKIELYIKYEKYEKLTAFLQKNNVDNGKMIDIVKTFKLNIICYKNLLEYFVLIKNDFLLEKFFSVIKNNVPLLTSETIMLTMYCLIFSKKTKLCIDFFNFINSSTQFTYRIEYTLLKTAYNLGLKDLFIFSLEKTDKKEIEKFFWFYKPGLLKSREECDEYILTNESLEKYLQNIPQKRKIALILNKLKMENDFENKCIENFVEIYKFVSNNKEYFGV